jgi:hypothetical protein
LGRNIENKTNVAVINSTWEAKNNWNEMAHFVRTGFENHLLSLVYIMLLILMNTVVAMKAHGIITNHRESIFIGIASGFSTDVCDHFNRSGWYKNQPLGINDYLNTNNKYKHKKLVDSLQIIWRHNVVC